MEILCLMYKSAGGLKLLLNTVSFNKPGKPMQFRTLFGIQRALLLKVTPVKIEVTFPLRSARR